jgi:signal transduction histidine kinase
MQNDQPVGKTTVSDSDEIFKPGPVGLFVASVTIIFIAEALVMVLLSFLDISGTLTVGLFDATLLSLIVVPTLYFMLLKPMRETILKLDNSERIQKQLEEIDQLKNDFISIASHEVCTPITAIMGYTEILLDDVESKQQKEYLKVILKKAQTLERIVGDLEIVNRLETGENLKVVQEEHDLLETVSHVCNVYRVRFPDKPIHLELPDAPLVLLFDEIRISQVLDNLFSNAVKYSNDIHDVLDVSVAEEETQVLICVRDEGIGMNEEELKYIYDKFFRAPSDTLNVGGLGLGMAIVKNIVESHNGTIDIVSQRKVGTTVTVALPKAV